MTRRRADGTAAQEDRAPERTVPASGQGDPEAILTSIGEAVYDWDLASDTLTWSGNAAQVFRLPDMGRLASGRAYATVVEPGSGETRYAAIHSSVRRDEGSGIPYRCRYMLRPAPELLLEVEDSGRWYAGENGKPVYAHGIVRAVPAGQRRVEGERAAFLDRLAREAARAKSARQPLALVIGAIDRLAAINEDLGYETADGVIEAVTARVATVLRARDHFVRYSGNRFAVVMAACPQDQIAGAAKRMADIIEGEPIDTAEGPIGVRLMLAGAALPDHALDAPTLLRRAELALSRASAGFGGSFLLYDPSFERSERRSHAPRMIDVVDALNDRRVGFALQPVVDATSRQPAFHEALLRIGTGDGTHIGAGRILPAIERAGLVPLLDARMLELVADHLYADPEAHASVNLSPLSLEGGGFLTTLAAHLGARPGIASRLIVEVTETAAVRDPASTAARLDAVKALGVTIAIDDFGAGHTSFRHLRNFPVDLVKIDGAFVQNLARSERDRYFVRALVDLARHLGIATVAEWVEDEESAAMLAGWGVDYLQGEHCGAPRLVASAPRRLDHVA